MIYIYLCFILAPELFDVKSESTLDEKVDIWVCSF